MVSLLSLPYSSECVEVEFCEVPMHDRAYPYSSSRGSLSCNRALSPGASTASFSS
jgi:hypothetical protein